MVRPAIVLVHVSPGQLEEIAEPKAGEGQRDEENAGR